MEIIVDIHEGDDGRPAGTVRAASGTNGRPFSGNLEFLALVEHLYRSDGDDTPARAEPPTIGTGPSLMPSTSSAAVHTQAGAQVDLARSTRDGHRNGHKQYR
jgi:hypothetical protein